MKLERSDYIRSLEQLLTISCILAGFTFSGLISLPGVEVSKSALYSQIVDYFQGNATMALCVSFYALFLSTIGLIGTIMIVLVYKINNYFVPTAKLRFVHLVSNFVFSFAIATLVVAVVSFGIPSLSGLLASVFIGVGMAACFIWENMLPSQHRRREEQIRKENAAASASAEAPTGER